jgi:hypothetical protein
MGAHLCSLNELSVLLLTLTSMLRFFFKKKQLKGSLSIYIPADDPGTQINLQHNSCWKWGRMRDMWTQFGGCTARSYQVPTRPKFKGQ